MIYMRPPCDPIAKFLLYQQQLWRKGLRKSGVFRGFLRRFHGMCYVLGRTRTARAYPPPHPNPLGGTGEGVVGLRGPVGTPPSGLGWNHHHDVIDLPGGLAARPTARAISAAPLLPISPPPSPIVQSVLHARHPSVWPCSAHACFCRPPSLAYLRVAMQRLRRLGARCSSLLERRAPGGVRCLVLGRCRCVS